MVEQSGPPSKEVLTLKRVQEFLKDGDDVVIIGVFQGDGDPAYLQYQDAGEYLPATLLRLWESRLFCIKLGLGFCLVCMRSWTQTVATEKLQML